MLRFAVAEWLVGMRNSYLLAPGAGELPLPL